MKNKATYFTLAAAALTGILLVAAPSSTVAQDPMDFEKDVWPILMDNCVVCHGPVDSFGELCLDSKERILKGGDMGKIVVPADPDKSPTGARCSCAPACRPTISTSCRPRATHSPRNNSTRFGDGSPRGPSSTNG
ncbi:MAG: c-type cytochrome domain-containing protein [Acidobacteriota bacterium]|nr:c-type cytochrome domain-containing protein [Acidobacteriota bacterium]